jgi:MoaA/NifB/PqqE/SkfB family radical SAM enzyme
MYKTIAIKPVYVGPMMVTWDLGRRCNYDCSYCTALHHNNHSRHRTVDELKHAFNFIKQWTDTYNNSRSSPFETTINFTGGEPTVNPNFWDLVDYVKSTDPSIRMSMTTNGAWHSKNTDKIIENFVGVTVSYHTEADTSLKEQVIENIYKLSNSDIWLQVNLMMHNEHWDECVNVYNELKSKNINVKIRPIGDGSFARKGWFIDSDGTNRKTSHEYTPEQQNWFYEQTGSSQKSNTNLEGNQLGRQCCGSRPLCGKVDNNWTSVDLVDNRFYDWSCMVDWYFLHIDQETELVYHHQTCRAKHGKRIGSIGSLSDTQSMLEVLNNRLNAETIEHIICPNSSCSCGMCVPKAQSTEDFNELFNSMR